MHTKKISREKESNGQDVYTVHTHGTQKRTEIADTSTLSIALYSRGATHITHSIILRHSSSHTSHTPQRTETRPSFVKPSALLLQPRSYAAHLTVRVGTETRSRASQKSTQPHMHTHTCACLACARGGTAALISLIVSVQKHWDRECVQMCCF